MKGKSFFANLIIMVVFGLATFYFLRLGYYPVALVDFKPISAKSLDEAFFSAEHYYEEAVRNGSLTLSLEDLRKKEILMEIRRASLDKIIINMLIHRELKKEVGSDLSGIVGDKIDSLEIKSPDFGEAVLAVYGLSLNRFREIVLLPQAREEVLRGNMTLKNRDFDAWLKDAKANAS